MREALVSTIRPQAAPPRCGYALSRFCITLACTLALLPVQAGNLYQAGQFRGLVSDRRAAGPGDILTVLVMENASATTSAGTSAGKTSSTRLGIAGPNTDKAVKVEGGDEYDGHGRIQRSGKLLAQITVTVVSAEDGLLHVKGQQMIAMNDEKQDIRIEGKVRVVDIGENNTVLSSRLADARISYVGDGVLAERQRPGWLSRMLHWLGLL